MHYPDFSVESLRLDMFFQFPLDQVLGERLSNVQTEKTGTIAKKSFFLSFKVPIKTFHCYCLCTIYFVFLQT